MTASRRLLLAALVLSLPVGLDAQVRRALPARPTPARDTVRPQPGLRDTIPPAADSAASDTTLHWSRSDPLLEELLKKPGYSVTRYEGDVVTFDALTKAFAIAAAAAQRAVVEREGQRVITDSVIVYNDRTRSVNVSGHFQILPGQGQPPIAGAGTAQYNLAERSGRLTNATVTVDESGERWFIRSEIGKTALGDSTRGIPPRFYGLGGSLTSCEDSIPDYHFRMREIKRSERTLVARPAVLYIRDIPVMWLPFVFQDIRPGRRSGILPPRFGASDIVRNNPNYRRHVENLGYYWAFSDYMDATTWLDWRSAQGGDSLDPGWLRLNGEWKYYWMSRFLSGRLASSYTRQRDGNTNLALSWGHQQRFGRNRNLTADVNYVTSTQLQRQNTFNPYQAIATIRSSVNYQDKFGPVSLQSGGTRTQFPGRQQVDQQLPTLSLSSTPLALGAWLLVTPSFRYSESANLRLDQPSTFSQRFIGDANGQLIRVDTLKRNRFDRSISFDPQLRIFGFSLSNNAVTIRDQVNDFPVEEVVYPDADSARKEMRVFRRTFRTDIDWNPTLSLPPFFQNRFKLTPSVSLQNVDPRPFWVRTELSGGKFVSQSKRLSYGVSLAPSVYGLWPGFGPFRRIRHALNPTLNYSYAPRAKVSNAYLAALGERRQGYLGALPSSSVSFGLSQNFEAKVRQAGDTTSGLETGQKLMLLTMNFSSITYDFERARATGRRLAGLTTDRFGSRFTSDLLPGMDVGVDYSLFQGSTLSDTAVFKPFLTNISAAFRIGQKDNPFAVISRLFGRAVPDQSPIPQPGVPQPAEEQALARQIASQPVAGQASRGQQFVTPAPKGWEATFSFNTTRSRRPTGTGVIEFDPRIRCEPFRNLNPIIYEQCRSGPVVEDTFPRTTAGAPAVHMPAQTALTSGINFELTPKWAASWQTAYDFEESQFASQTVSLQRDLHDWRAVFAFTQSPNGNFAFTFFIALKAQPDLKFDYSRATYRSQ